MFEPQGGVCFGGCVGTCCGRGAYLWLWPFVVCCLWCVVFVLVLLAQINPIGRCRSPIQLHTVGGCLKVSKSSSIRERRFYIVSLKEDFSQPFLPRSETAG